MTAWKPDVCIYHGNCDDGFGAAWAIWKKWPDCEFVAGFYGMPLPDVAGRHVLFVDFSAKRAVIDELAQTAKTIVIIDHHKTAEADLEPFKVTMCGSAILNPHDIQHMFRDLAELDRPPIVAWFDMEQSGAAMAWQFAQSTHRDHAVDGVPAMLTLIEDRDLWRFTYGDDTRQFSAALRTYVMDFATWDDVSLKVHDLIKEGQVVLRSHRANIHKLMRETYTVTIGGFAVPVVNAPYHYASDTAHELLTAYPDAPFAACWFRRADGQIQWSLRSEEHRQDVSDIAKAFGGGGHRNAAGFQSPAPDANHRSEAHRPQEVDPRWMSIDQINALILDLEQELRRRDGTLKPDNPMSFFMQSVDSWGADEWFDRLANAIRKQDEAAVAMHRASEEDKVLREADFDLYRMIAHSSAMRLVRDYEPQVRAALATAPEASDA